MMKMTAFWGAGWSMLMRRVTQQYAVTSPSLGWAVWKHSVLLFCLEEGALVWEYKLLLTIRKITRRKQDEAPGPWNSSAFCTRRDKEQSVPKLLFHTIHGVTGIYHPLLAVSFPGNSQSLLNLSLYTNYSGYLSIYYPFPSLSISILFYFFFKWRDGARKRHVTANTQHTDTPQL